MFKSSTQTNIDNHRGELVDIRVVRLQALSE